MNETELLQEELKNRRRIVEETDKNVLISAGAGAGKTTLLVSSVVRHLTANPDLAESEVVVITFTNAAVEHLRQQIAKYLKRENISTGRDIRIDDIHISTIHSFCNSLLRQRAFDCGLSVAPPFREYTKKEKNDLLGQFIRRYIQDHKEEYLQLYEKMAEQTYMMLFRHFEKIAFVPELNIELPEETPKKMKPEIKQEDPDKHLIGMDTAYKIAVFIKKMYEDFRDIRAGLELEQDSILYLTDKLLDNQSALEYFRTKYKVFFVDEFQDTDYLQLRILERLACDTEGKLRPGSLFLVGDKKQSIYRFRGADVYFYQYIHDGYFQENNDDHAYYELRMNFRSQKEIIDDVNGMYFDNTRNPQYFNCFPSTEKMLPAHVAEINDSPGEDVILPGVKQIKLKRISSVVDLVLNFKQKKLRTLVLQDDQWCYRDRPVEWGDFLVLVDDKWEISDLYKNFTQNAIPVRVAGLMELKEKRAVKRLCALIQYLTFPDRLHRARVVAAFSPNNKLMKADNKLNERKGSVFDQVKKSEAEGIVTMIRECESVYQEKGIKKALYHALCQGWLTDSEVYDISLISELPVLYQFFEGLFTFDVHGMDAVNIYLERFVNQDVRKQLSMSEDENCVRLMNFHQAKGLEGNIVFNVMKNDKQNILENTEKAAENMQIKGNCYRYLDGTSILRTPSVYLTISQKESSSQYAKKRYFPIMTEEQEERFILEEMQETVRDYYVRDTRAKDFRYDCWKTWKNGFKIASEYEVKEMPTLLKPKSQTAVNRTSVMSLSPSRLENDLPADVTETAVQSEERYCGKEYGTIMHRAFELYLLNCKLEGEPSLEAAACQAVLENYSLIRQDKAEQLRKRLLSDLETFAEAFRQRFPDPEVRSRVAAETPFYFVFDSLKESEESDFSRKMLDRIGKRFSDGDQQKPEKVYFSGITDLIVFGKEGEVSRVIDYKSDTWAQNGALLLEQYGPQQQAYIGCMQELLAGQAEFAPEQLLYSTHLDQHWLEETT